MPGTRACLGPGQTWVWGAQVQKSQESGRGPGRSRGAGVAGTRVYRGPGRKWDPSIEALYKSGHMSLVLRVLEALYLPIFLSNINNSL